MFQKDKAAWFIEINNFLSSSGRSYNFLMISPNTCTVKHSFSSLHRVKTCREEYHWRGKFFKLVPAMCPQKKKQIDLTLRIRLLTCSTRIAICFLCRILSNSAIKNVINCHRFFYFLEVWISSNWSYMVFIDFEYYDLVFKFRKFDPK